MLRTTFASPEPGILTVSIGRSTQTGTSTTSFLFAWIVTFVISELGFSNVTTAGSSSNGAKLSA